MNSKGRVSFSKVYSEEGSTDYKYYYTNENVTKIDVIERFRFGKRWSIYLEYDDHPNPWYEMNTLDDYRSFSKNNITVINDYPYNRWEYDDDRYPILLNSTIDGQLKYYYK